MTGNSTWTDEDQAVIAHAIARSDTSFMVLVGMVNGGCADYLKMLDRTIGRLNDEYTAIETEDLEGQEEFHAWAQACSDQEEADRQDAEADAMRDDGIPF